MKQKKEKKKYIKLLSIFEKKYRGKVLRNNEKNYNKQKKRDPNDKRK